MKELLLLLLLTLITTSCTSQGQDKNQGSDSVIVASEQNSTFSWEKDSSIIDGFFERYSGNNAGASFMVIKDGKVLASKSYGYADVKKKIKATAYTNYRTASATKQFTGMAIMMLIHEGKLSYESKLTDIFPDFPIYGKKVSVKHLLIHRSGLVDYMNLMEDGRKEQILDDDVLQLMKQQDHTLFKPGSKYEYSNSAYAVLAEIIAKVSGVSFAEHMKTTIFEPLKMNNTCVYEKGKTIANRAYGHVNTYKGFFLNDQSTTSAVQGDGGVYTSASDYYKWDQALYTDKLLPLAEFEKGILAWYDDPKLLVQKYGHGWRIDYIEGTKITHHSGHTKGFTNYTIRIPALKLSFVGFSNRNNEDAIIRIGNTLAALFSDHKLPIPIAPFVEATFDKSGTNAAIEQYKKLQAENNSNYLFTETALFVLGKKLQNKKKLTEAIQIYEFNLAQFPTSLSTCYELANCYFANKEEKKATAFYKKAINLIPKEYQEVLKVSNKRIK